MLTPAVQCRDIASAPVLRGTRCSRPVLVWAEGIVHTAVVRSTSSHVAFLASPLRVAVRVRNFERGDGCQWASVASTARTAAAT